MAPPPAVLVYSEIAELPNTLQLANAASPRLQKAPPDAGALPTVLPKRRCWPASATLFDRMVEARCTEPLTLQRAPPRDSPPSAEPTCPEPPVPPSARLDENTQLLTLTAPSQL